MVPAAAALTLFNKDLSDLAMLLLEESEGFPGPLDRILAYVQFPGQGYFEIIGRHGYSQNMNRTSAFVRKKRENNILDKISQV